MLSQLIDAVLPKSGKTQLSEQPITVSISRHDLYKRRWRALADDGIELAYAEIPDQKITDGTIVRAGAKNYRVAQISEEVIAVELPDDPSMASKIGWYFGNRHIPIEVRETEIVVEEFPTLCESLSRIGIPFTRRTDILRCPAHSEHRH